MDVTEKPYHVLQVEDLRGLNCVAQTQRVADIVRKHGTNTKVMVDAREEARWSSSSWTEGIVFSALGTDKACFGDEPGLAVLIERHHLVLPPVPELLAELRYYEGRTTRAEHTKFGAPEGAAFSDDLVTAVMLAVHVLDGGVQPAQAPDSRLSSRAVPGHLAPTAWCPLQTAFLKSGGIGFSPGYLVRPEHSSMIGAPLNSLPRVDPTR